MAYKSTTTGLKIRLDMRKNRTRQKSCDIPVPTTEYARIVLHMPKLKLVLRFMKPVRKIVLRMSAKTSRSRK